MKTLLFASLFLICTSANAQTKKDSKIIVTVADTANLFNTVVSKLFEKGFTILQKDESLGLIATGEKSIKSAASIKLKAIVKDSTITLFGEVANDVTVEIWGAKLERTFAQIYFGGMKGSDMRNGWNEMDSIAHEFGNKISYSK